MKFLLYNTFFVSFWLSSTICFLLDIFMPYLRVNAHQINREIVLKNYQKMFPLVTFNLFAAYPFFYYAENQLILMTPNSYPILINIALWLVTTDFLFYTIHRAFHTKYLYFIHSIHHQFNYTYGMGAIYAHPIELYFSNLLPVAAPMFLYNIPYRVCDAIVFLATMYTIIVSHGSYTIDLGRGHLYHHLKYKCNYGLIKTDRLFGTKFIEKSPEVSQSTSSTDAEPAPEPAPEMSTSGRSV